MVRSAKKKSAKGQVSNTIKIHRKAMGLTQQDLADRAGATRQTIIAIEAEKYAPSLELAFQIAEELGQPFEEIFKFKRG